MAENEVAVATFESETEALMLAELLKSNGIPSVLVPIGMGVGGLGSTVWRPFEMRVRTSDATRARQMIEDFRGK